MVRLGDVCTVQRGVRVTRKDLNEFGKYNVFQNSLKPLGKFDSFNCDANNPFVIMALAAGEVGFSNQPFWAADDCTYFTDLKNLDCKYLYFILLKSRQELRQNVKQATIPRLSNKFLEGLSIPLPPLPVQREIVERLERELAEADSLAANFKRIAELADAEFKAELEETFERVEGERVRLGDICDNHDNARIPITKDQRRPGPYPYYGASGIVDHVERYIFDGDFLLVSEDGANLVARTTPIAFSVSGKIWVNNHAHVLSFCNAQTQKFVEYYFASISVTKIVTGAAQPKLTQKALNDIRIPLPGLKSQGEIVACLDAAKNRCEKLKVAAELGLRASETLRAAILSEAFAP